MSIRLMVLGLLNDSPKSGYAVQKWLEESSADAWADVQIGSIYHALRQMEKEGLLQVQANIQTGYRSKAIYTITEAGRTEFRQLLRDALQTLPRSFPAAFYTMLVFVEELPRTEILAAIDLLIPKLEQEIEAWRTGEVIKQGLIDLPPHVRVIFANGREHLEADLRMLHQLKEIVSQP
jgi:DNA-binding PadR family transcriptional regulator